jgi:hypothetical protein
MSFGRDDDTSCREVASTTPTPVPLSPVADRKQGRLTIGPERVAALEAEPGLEVWLRAKLEKAKTEGRIGISKHPAQLEDLNAFLARNGVHELGRFDRYASLIDPLIENNWSAELYGFYII